MENLVINNIQKNQNLKEVLEKNGIIFNEDNYMINIEEIGFGSSSSIYEIKGNNKVLKISNSFEEFEANELLQIKSISDKNLVNYFLIPLIITPINKNFYQQLNTEDISDNKNYQRYYFIFDKLYLLGDLEKDIFNEISFYFTLHNLEEFDLYDDFNLDKIKDILFKRFNNKYEKFFNWLLEVYDYIINNGFSDVHIHNIMQTEKGEYRIIDLKLDY